MSATLSTTSTRRAMATRQSVLRLQQDESGARGERDRLGAARGAELAAQRRDVELRRVLANAQAPGDAFVGQSLGDQLQDLQLAWRERLGRLARRGDSGERLERARSDGQVEEDQACLGGADGEVDLIGVGVAAEA